MGNIVYATSRPEHINYTGRYIKELWENDNKSKGNNFFRANGMLDIVDIIEQGGKLSNNTRKIK